MVREEMIKKVCESVLDKAIEYDMNRHRCYNCGRYAEKEKDIKHGNNCPTILAKKILYETCENCKYEKYGMNKSYDEQFTCVYCHDYDEFVPREEQHE
jgi:ribosomal protein S26